MDPMLINFVAPAIAVLVGLWLKRKPWFNNKFIPIASFVLAFITRVLAGLGVGPAPEATAVAPAMMALSFGSLGHAFLTALWKALIDAIVATGVHSGSKNVIEGLAKKKV